MSNALKILIATLLPLGSSAITLAYEVDNFTNRSRQPADATDVLDRETNRLIAQAITETNARGRCRPGDLNETHLPPIYEAVKNALDSNPVATIESYANDDSHVPRNEAPDPNIYSGGGILDGVILFVAGIEPSVRVGTHYFGVDKLGHFMAQGFEYFEMAFERGSSLSQVFAYGNSLENGRYGLETTGVKSYGDLGANWSGMQFWRDLMFGDSPMIVCEHGQYVRRRVFSWADYANDSWDEATNCSAFNDGTRRTVETNLRRLGMSCPVSRPSCQSLSRLPCANRFLSPQCMDSSIPATACPDQLPGLPARASMLPAGTGESAVRTTEPGPMCGMETLASEMDETARETLEWTTTP